MKVDRLVGLGNVLLQTQSVHLQPSCCMNARRAMLLLGRKEGASWIIISILVDHIEGKVTGLPSKSTQEAQEHAPPMTAFTVCHVRGCKGLVTFAPGGPGLASDLVSPKKCLCLECSIPEEKSTQARNTSGCSFSENLS